MARVFTCLFSDVTVKRVGLLYQARKFKIIQSFEDTGSIQFDWMADIFSTISQSSVMIFSVLKSGRILEKDVKSRSE